MALAMLLTLGWALASEKLEMHTIVGVVLIVAGIVSMLVGYTTYLQAEADLFERRPDLSSVTDMWNKAARFREVSKNFKLEFPRSRKLHNYRILSVAGIASLLTGFIVLAEYIR
jgi:hypothetical protein